MFANCLQWTVCFPSGESSTSRSPLSSTRTKSLWQVAHIDLAIRGQRSSESNSPNSPSAAISPVLKTPPCSVTARYSLTKALAKCSNVNMTEQSASLSAINRHGSCCECQALPLPQPLTIKEQLHESVWCVRCVVLCCSLPTETDAGGEKNGLLCC